MPRKVRFLRLILGSVTLSACAFAQVFRRDQMTGSTWTCADSSSEIARDLRTWISGYTAPQSAKADSFRMRLQLPRLVGDSVTIVTDPAVCRHAGLAYVRANAQQLSAGTYEMAVIRTGSCYVVRGVTAPAPAGEWKMISIFDAKFRLTGSVLGP
jgi:hypothetical protein